MRIIALLLASAILGSCMATTPQPIRSAKNERLYQDILAGKVARPVINCVPTYNSNDMTIIDSQTVVFKIANNRAYVVHLTPGCTNLGLGPYALVTRQYGSAQLCHGDIATVFDTLARQTVGSCTIGAITPYVKPGLKGY